ncbi:aldose epimerase family protein [Umezakia ovalisporum]|uniref:aldose epimerase family protein n=1 Tax=Umezakia ovalisporum TaxID=75695 RepID=UPI0035B8FBC4
MFTITVEHQQDKTYILTDESAGSQIEVVPARGGVITRWRIQGQEIFYLDTERFTHPDLSVRGGNPILFPICGNLVDNSYSHNGQQYTLKQHGFARDLPWQVTEQETQNQASLTLVLCSNEETKAVYPFDFEVIFTYELQGNTLAIRQKYKNLSSTPMPFSAGFHPYFLTGIDKNQLELKIPSQHYQEKGSQEIHSFAGNFDFNRDEIDVAFKNLTSQSATVIDRSRALELVLDYDPIYSCLVFWTLKGKDFYCLEPWTASRNALNTGENLTVLDPNAMGTAFVRLTANFL